MYKVGKGFEYYAGYRALNLKFQLEHIKEQVEDCKSEGYPFEVSLNCETSTMSTNLPRMTKVFRDDGNQEDVFGSAKTITSDKIIDYILRTLYNMEESSKGRELDGWGFSIVVEIKNNQGFSCSIPLAGCLKETMELYRKETGNV